MFSTLRRPASNSLSIKPETRPRANTPSQYNNPNQYRTLHSRPHPGYAGSGLRKKSVARITDQRLAGPEYQHQEDSKHAKDGEHRLVQDEPGDIGPEPWCDALDPGANGLLACLVDVVPELAEPREPQVLIGDPARPVINHENESAGQQQQPHQSEKTADHASPFVCRAPKTPVSQYRDDRGNSTSSVPYEPRAALRTGPFGLRKR